MQSQGALSEVTRRLVVTSLLALAVLATTCALLSKVILLAEERRLVRELKSVQNLYSQSEADRAVALETQAKLLVALPQFRNAVGGNRIHSGALEGFREFIRADFVAVVDEDLDPTESRRFNYLTNFIETVRRTGQPAHGYADSGKALERVVAVPVRFTGAGEAVLIACYRIGEDTLAKLQDSSGAEFVVVATGERAASAKSGNRLFLYTSGAAEFFSPAGTKEELSRKLDALVAVGETPIFFRGGEGQFAAAGVPLVGAGGAKVARLVALRSLAEGSRLAARARVLTIMVFAVFFVPAFIIVMVMGAGNGTVAPEATGRLDAETDAGAEELEHELEILRASNAKLVDGNNRLLKILRENSRKAA